MSRRNRRLNSSPRHPFPASAHDRTTAAEPPRLQVRRLSLALGTLAGAALSLPLTAPALTLGDITIGSTLGQPLQARVPVQLAAGETAGPDCTISLRQGTSAPAAPPGTKLQFGKAAAGKLDLQITTAQSLYEPMYELDLALRCPGGATIVRQYVLMLDLPTTAAETGPGAAGTVPAAAAASPMVGSPDHAAASPAAPAPVRAHPAQPSPPLAPGVLYRVQSGDTLSTIAARMRDRGGLSIWQLAAQIFADNPQAFIGADPDRIRLGTQIMLPAPVESAAPPAETAASQAVADALPETVTAPGPLMQDQLPQETTTADLQVATTTAAASPAAVVPPAKAALRKPDRTQAAPLRKPAAPAARQRTMQDTVEQEAPAWQAILLGALIGVMASAALLRERLRDTASALGRRWKKTPPFVRLAPAGVVAAAPPLPVANRPDQGTAMMVEESPRKAPADDFAGAVPTAHARVDHLDDTVESPVAAAPQPEHAIRQPAEAFEFDTLAHHADAEQSAANALQEVLELLESDYEQEMTVSQVIDRSRFTADVDEPADAHDDDTLVRATKMKVRA